MPEPTIEEIAGSVRALCNATRLSQADAARLLGVPPKTLNDWLPTAKRPPRTTCRHRQMLSLALETLATRLKI